MEFSVRDHTFGGLFGYIVRNTLSKEAWGRFVKSGRRTAIIGAVVTVVAIVLALLTVIAPAAALCVVALGVLGVPIVLVRLKAPPVSEFKFLARVTDLSEYRKKSAASAKPGEVDATNQPVTGEYSTYEEPTRRAE
jgi:hypothetical protein